MIISARLWRAEGDRRSTREGTKGVRYIFPSLCLCAFFTSLIRRPALDAGLGFLLWRPKISLTPRQARGDGVVGYGGVTVTVYLTTKLPTYIAV